MENNIFMEDLELDNEFYDEKFENEEFEEDLEEDFSCVLNEENCIKNLATAVLKQVCVDYAEWQRFELGLKKPLKDKKKMTEVETSGKDALYTLTLKEYNWWLDMVDLPYNRKDLKKKIDSMLMGELRQKSVAC